MLREIRRVKSWEAISHDYARKERRERISSSEPVYSDS
jgi:hypothetical protein